MQFIVKLHYSESQLRVNRVSQTFFRPLFPFLQHYATMRNSLLTTYFSHLKSSQVILTSNHLVAK